MDALAVLPGRTQCRPGTPRTPLARNPPRAPARLPFPRDGRQAGRRGWHGFAVAGD